MYSPLSLVVLALATVVGTGGIPRAYGFALTRRVILVDSRSTTEQRVDRCPGAAPGLHMSVSTGANGAASSIKTLTDETTWQLRLNLYGCPTKQGRRVNQLFNVDVKFSPDEGYEPPQGSLSQIMTGVGNSLEDGPSLGKSGLTLTSSRWQLSEDPDDRKDGLWVWGLFKEPLYPFLLLQMETAEVPLPGDEGDSIEPLALYGQLIHKRNKDTGNVELEGCALNVREIESVKDDVFGAARVDVYDEVDVGRLSIKPL